MPKSVCGVVDATRAVDQKVPMRLSRELAARGYSDYYTYMDLLRLPTDFLMVDRSRLQTYIRSLCESLASLPDPYGNRALAPHL